MAACSVPKDIKRAVKDSETLEQQVRRAKKLVLEMETKLVALMCQVRDNEELRSKIKSRKPRTGYKSAA